MCNELTFFLWISWFISAHTCTIQWWNEIMTSKGAIHFQSKILFQWFESPLRNVAALYRLLKLSTTIWTVRKQRIWQILKTFLSYMMLAYLEYSRAHSYKSLFIYFSLYFVRDYTLDFIFPLLSPHWLLDLTLLSWLLTDWLLSNNISPISKRHLPGTVHIALE